jgi:hypothetical protein
MQASRGWPESSIRPQLQHLLLSFLRELQGEVLENVRQDGNLPLSRTGHPGENRVGLKFPDTGGNSSGSCGVLKGRLDDSG